MKSRNARFVVVTANHSSPPHCQTSKTAAGGSSGRGSRRLQTAPPPPRAAAPICRTQHSPAAGPQRSRLPWRRLCPGAEPRDFHHRPAAPRRSPPAPDSEPAAARPSHAWQTQRRLVTRAQRQAERPLSAIVGRWLKPLREPQQRPPWNLWRSLNGSGEWNPLKRHAAYATVCISAPWGLKKSAPLRRITT